MMSNYSTPLILAAILTACTGEKDLSENRTEKSTSAKEDQKSDGEQAKKLDPPKETKKEEKEKAKTPKPILNIAPPPDFASAPADAESLESGLRHKTLTDASNPKTPQKDEWVEVHYTGWNSKGEAFISTAPSKRSRTLPLRGFPKGLQEGIKLMGVNQKKRLWVPEKLAPKGKRVEKGPVVYDVELVSIKQEPKPPEALTPPKNAKTTLSGLSFRTIKRSKKGLAPTNTSLVSVHITQWNAQGRLIMSTSLQGRPMNFNMAHKSFPPALWKEAAMLLKQGEKGRFWLPVKEKAAKIKSGHTILEMELLTVKEAPQKKTPQVNSQR